MVFERAANNAAPTEMMPGPAAAGADLKWFFTLIENRSAVEKARGF